MMDEMHATSQKMVSGYEVLSRIEEVEVATTPKELVWENDLVKL